MKLKSIYIALGLSLLLSGCKSEEPAPQAENAAPFVSFTIALSMESNGTRADARIADGEEPNTGDGGDNEWGNGGTESGTKFENTVNNIIPVLYSATKQPNGKVTINSAYPVGEMVNAVYDRNDTDGTLTITGQLKTEIPASMLEEEGHTYRLAVFVNAKKGFNIKQPEQNTFHRHGIPSNLKIDGTEDIGIPMYGVHEVKFDGLANGLKDGKYLDSDNPYVLGETFTIPVLRSMAKVIVRVDEEKLAGRDVKLSKVEISRHVNKGYLVPKGWDTCTSVSELTLTGAMNGYVGTLDQDYDKNCPILPTDDNTNSDTFLRFFLPETYNSNHDDISTTEPIKLTVTYTSDGTSDEKTGVIYFANYDDDGKPTDWEKNAWDIIRNHIYEFVIEGVEASTGELKVNVSVKPWVIHHYELNEDEILVK